MCNLHHNILSCNRPVCAYRLHNASIIESVLQHKRGGSVGTGHRQTAQELEEKCGMAESLNGSNGPQNGRWMRQEQERKQSGAKYVETAPRWCTTGLCWLEMFKR